MNIKHVLEKITSFILEDFQSEPGNLISTFNQAVAFLNEHPLSCQLESNSRMVPQIELRTLPLSEPGTNPSSAMPNRRTSLEHTL